MIGRFLVRSWVGFASCWGRRKRIIGLQICEGLLVMISICVVVCMYAPKRSAWDEHKTKEGMNEHRNHNRNTARNNRNQP